MRFQYLVQHGAKMAFKVLGRLPFNKNSIHMPNGTVHCGCTEPTQLSHCMFGFVLESSRIRKPVLWTTILSNGKEHFGPTDRNNQIGQKWSTFKPGPENSG